MESNRSTTPVESELSEIPIIDPPASRERLDTAWAGNLADALYNSRVRRIVTGIQEALQRGGGTLDCRKVLCEAALNAAKDLDQPDPDADTSYYAVLGAMVAGMQGTSFGYAACKDAAAVVVAEAEGALSGLAEIEKGESEVQGVIARLDPKSRAIVGTLLFLGELEGSVNGPDWPQRLLSNVLDDAEQTKEAFAACPDDPDVATMRRFFDLTWHVMAVAEPDQYEDEAQEAGESEATK